VGPRIDLRGIRDGVASRLPRARVDREAVRERVRALVARVRDCGDAAALAIQAEVGVAPAALRVSAEEVEAARAACAPALLAAIEFAAGRVRTFHERQLAEERAPFWRTGDEHASVGEESRPLGRVGCCVPGGVAPLPSTVLMTALPARIAGVREVIVCTPPAEGGRVHQATLAACAVAGVDEVYAIGGAQGVAAMAYGTESVARVDKIVGPGGIWTTLAKHEVSMDVGVDSFAGPTEIAIVADSSADPVLVACDLVAQAEHDPLATALLITPDEGLAAAVEVAVEKELSAHPRREAVEQALASGGHAVIVDDVEHAITVANAFAPEHLELIVEGAAELAAHATTAGAVFAGPYSPVSLGDYVAGTNHVLPTAGSGRFASPLRVADFIRSAGVIAFDRAGVEEVAPALIALAEAEGLTAHARAVRARLERP